MLALFMVGPAQAGFQNCSAAERRVLIDASAVAQEALALAEASVSIDNDLVEVWFGDWDAGKAETVRDVLSLVRAQLRVSRITFYCADLHEEDCDRDSYANVDPKQAYTIFICPRYFELPALMEVEDVSAEEFGTREGTIIHEMTHFPLLGDTWDECYGREECSDYAREYPDDAATNADAYQYFVEDVARR